MRILQPGRPRLYCWSPAATTDLANIIRRKPMASTRELRPLGEALGTEALGVDLSRPVDVETFSWIEEAFAEHPVLVFRDQNLGAAELAAFGRRFGVPRKHSLVKYRHP